MYDIDFYMKISRLKRRLMSGEKRTGKDVFNRLEQRRSHDPVVYSIETTNACHLRCHTCPRTTMMKRPIKTLDMETFKRIARAIKPFSKERWQRWERFVKKEYRVTKNEMSENHFFLLIIAKAIALHGYGDPLLDKNMPERVKILSEKNIPTYFSCHPDSLDMEKIREIFKSGLSYLKLSGNFLTSPNFHKKIDDLLTLKRKGRYPTSIIISMVDCDKPGQKEEFKRLKGSLAGKEVYLYWKSQDQRWYKRNSTPNRSIHWLEFCQFPWSSISIKSNGDVVQCECDLNSETVIGNAKKESLHRIWNGPRARSFREDHFNLRPDIKCTLRCDRPLVGKLIKS